MRKTIKLWDLNFTCSKCSIKQATVESASFDFNNHNLTVIQFVDSMGLPFTWSTIAQGLRQTSEFRDQWNQVWASVPFDFQWKPVPIHGATASTFPFFAALAPDNFVDEPDPFDFRQYFQALKPYELVATFDNLSGTAQLLAPKPPGNYGHLASFCRHARVEQQQTLWERVGEIVLRAIEQKIPVWCNTHGHGVPWLHIRFDSYLKYPVFPIHNQINEITQALWYENYRQCFFSCLVKE